ncbi:MAG: hypothetical protein ACK5LO_14830 [Leucobacter sp.]
MKLFTPVALGVASVAALLSAVGCTGTSGTAGSSSSDTHEVTSGGQNSDSPTEASTATVTYAHVALHSFSSSDGDVGPQQLVTEAERANGGAEALLTGPIAVNEAGCFGVSVSTESTPKFTPVVFPYGTEIYGASSLEFKGAAFEVGDVVALAGGFFGVPEKESADYTAFESCSAIAGQSDDGWFGAWGELQSLADFEQKYPSAESE